MCVYMDIVWLWPILAPVRMGLDPQLNMWIQFFLELPYDDMIYSVFSVYLCVCLSYPSIYYIFIIYLTPYPLTPVHYSFPLNPQNYWACTQTYRRSYWSWIRKSTLLLICSRATGVVWRPWVRMVPVTAKKTTWWDTSRWSSSYYTHTVLILCFIYWWSWRVGGWRTTPLWSSSWR